MEMIGIIYSVGAALCFAIAPVIYSSFLKRLSPYTVNFLRISIVCIVTGLALLLLKGSSAFSILYYFLFLMFIIVLSGTIIGDTLYLYTIKYIGPTIAQAITSTYPLFVYLLAKVFTSEELTLIQLLAISLVVLGLMIIYISFRNIHKHTQIRIKGLVLGIVCAFTWSLSIAISAYVLQYMSALRYLALRNIVAAIMLSILFSKKLVNELPKLSVWKIIIILVSGFIELGVGIYLAAIALRIIGATINSTITSLSPLITMLITRTFKVEILNMKQTLGLILLVIGIVIIIIS